MIADLFTKAFSDRAKFEHLRMLSGLATDITHIQNGVEHLKVQRDMTKEPEWALDPPEAALSFLSFV